MPWMSFSKDVPRPNRRDLESHVLVAKRDRRNASDSSALIAGPRISKKPQATNQIVYRERRGWTGYSPWAKRYVVLDVVGVAIGFVVRALAGGVAIDSEVSQSFLIVQWRF